MSPRPSGLHRKPDTAQRRCAHLFPQVLKLGGSLTGMERPWMSPDSVPVEPVLRVLRYGW